MSVPRLTFLYPPRLLQRRLLTTTPRRLVEPKRHGTAVDPSLHRSPGATSGGSSNTTSNEPRQPVIGVNYTKVDTDGSTAPAAQAPKTSSSPSPGPATSTTSTSPPQAPPSPTSTDTPEPPTATDPAPWPTLGDPPPSTAPPLHHFDTYTLVKRLSTPQTFTAAQSTALISSLRHLLLHHLSLASSQYISRSDISNQSYLFTTACSELRQSVYTQRRTDLDQLRLERNRIQSDFDELNQRFMVELLDMRNEISDMFNERKMQGRAEMRGMENKIVELNYKITIMLGSEVRSEIEKLRWVTTRRGLAAIGALATVVFICLRMNGSNKKKKEADASSTSSPSTSPPALPPAPTSGHLFEIQQSPASQ